MLNETILVSPYPYLEISRKKPPMFYFEIYNVRSAGITENIQISYSITSIKGKSNILKSLSNLVTSSKKQSVSVIYTRPVTGENMQEFIGVDFKNVKKGWHLLEVSVSSPQDSTIKASVRRRLLWKTSSEGCWQERSNESKTDLLHLGKNMSTLKAWVKPLLSYDMLA